MPCYSSYSALFIGKGDYCQEWLHFSVTASKMLSSDLSGSFIQLREGLVPLELWFMEEEGLPFEHKRDSKH